MGLKNLILNIMDDATVLSFLKAHRVGVISSNSLGQPQAAVVNYGVADNFEIIIETLDTTRKYKNIMADKKVAFTVTDNENITVQYEGDAYEVGKEDLEVYRHVYFAENPEPKKWETTGAEKYIKIVPRWLRYSNFIKQPREIFELKF